MNKITTVGFITSLVSTPVFANDLIEHVGIFFVGFTMLCIILIIHATIRTIQYTMESEHKIKTALLSTILSIVFLTLCIGIPVGLVFFIFNNASHPFLNGIVFFSSPIAVAYTYYKFNSKFVENTLNKII